MSSHDLPDDCEFEHTFEVYDRDEEAGGPPGEELRSDIKEGKIKDLDELAEEQSDEADPYFLRPIMGDHYKKVKAKSGSQGKPYTFILVAADDFDTNLNYEVEKTFEKVFISPQSQFHQEYMQRKQQAEQNIKQTMQGYEQLIKQKHMLEHDIRKLRSRAEAVRSGDETQLKSDFIELVDGAGAAGQQGGDEMALKGFRDNNIYPSIVADFNEMDSVEDLEEGNKLGQLPENEKAILKKKYKMYERWKDLYGSEVQRKLDELKAQLNRIERSIEETKTWLEPYVRDMQMINQKSRDEIGDDISKYMTFEGYSTQHKEIEFICYKPLRNEEGTLVEHEDEDTATHYKIVYMHCVHVNIAGGGQPQSPAEGPTIGVVHWFPAIVCRHVFENFFQAKIDRGQEQFEQVMQDYTGEFNPGEGQKIRDALDEESMSVMDLRKKVAEEIDENVPVEFSAAIRRVQDGFEPPEHIAEEYSEAHLEAIDEILGTEFTKEDEEGGKKSLTDFQKKIKEFTGQYNIYHLPDPGEDLDNFKQELKFSYYYDLKLGFGMYTMK